MRRAPQKVAFQFTFLFRRQGSQWSALACEVDVASCGKTLADAHEGLKDAVELYVSYMFENGLRDEIARPVPKEALDDFAAGARGKVRVERHTMIAVLHPIPSGEEMEAEFIPTELSCTVCDLPIAALPTA